MPHFRLVRLTEKSRRPPRIKPKRLVAAELGDDRLGVRGVPLEQAVLEAAEAEEVVLLLVVLHLDLVDRAQVAVDQLVVGVVLLAGHAVLALVHVELDVAGVVAPLQQLADAHLVALLGGADEVVVGDVQLLPRLLVQRGDRVDELLRRLAGGVGRVLHLLAVLVGAGEEVDLLAEQAVPPGEGVADDRRVRVTEVGARRHVVDRRGEEVRVGHGAKATARHNPQSLPMSARPVDQDGDP